MRARWIVALVVALIADSSGACHRDTTGVTSMQGGNPESFVTLRREPGPCDGGPCGWLLRAVNRHDAEMRVDRIDGSDAAALEAEDGQLILRGALRDRAWLEGRVSDGSALVAGQFEGRPGEGGILRLKV